MLQRGIVTLQALYCDSRSCALPSGAESLLYRKEKNEKMTVEVTKMAFEYLRQIPCWIFLCRIFLFNFGGSVYGVIVALSRPHTDLRIFQAIILNLLFKFLVLVFVLLPFSVRSLHNAKNVNILVAIPLALIYFAARIYILVESFISMQSLPARVL